MATATMVDIISPYADEGYEQRVRGAIVAGRRDAWARSVVVLLGVG